MALDVFPKLRGLTWTVTKTPTFPTIVQTSPSFVETRISQAMNPVWDWTLVFDYLKDSATDMLPGQTYTDLRTLMGFFLSMRGRAKAFLLDDDNTLGRDNSVGPALNSDSSPNTLASLQVVTDGVTWYSPIQRCMGGMFWEDISDLNGSIAVYANGVRKAEGIDFNVIGPGVAIPGYSYSGLVIQWVTQPATPVTAQFNFYFRVRFSEDNQDFERFMEDIWTIGGSGSKNGSGTIKLHGLRNANTGGRSMTYQITRELIWNLGTVPQGVTGIALAPGIDLAFHRIVPETGTLKDMVGNTMSWLDPGEGSVWLQVDYSPPGDNGAHWTSIMLTGGVADDNKFVIPEGGTDQYSLTTFAASPFVIEKDGWVRISALDPSAASLQNAFIALRYLVTLSAS